MRHISGWGTVAGLVEGNFAAFVAAQIFQGSPLLITIAATTPVAAHLTNLVWGMFCVGRPKVRMMTLSAAGVVLMTGAVGAVPATHLGGWIFVVQMAAAQFFMTGIVSTRAALWKANYPQWVRARLAARVQILRTLTQLGTLGVGAAVLNSTPGSYRWLYPAVALVGAVSLLMLRGMRVRGERGMLARIHRGEGTGLVEPLQFWAVLSPRRVLAGAARVLRADVPFRNYCIAQMCAGTANLMVRSVAVVVIADQLLGDMPASFWVGAVLLDVMPRLLTLGSMARFAAYFDRVGVLRFRVLHGVGWFLTLVFGMFGAWATARGATTQPALFLLGMASFTAYAMVRGICYGGGNIAWNLGHLHFAHPQDAEVYMGIHVSLTGLRGLILPSVGMLLWHGVGDWSGLGWSVWAVAAFFAALATLLYAWLARADAQQQTGDKASETLDTPARRDSD
ncbi:MAG TPA: hypothetical protein P5572_10810 [Phycisphaerae bacterium]|nr:hypothetical protein [Phycisphaerales bacterium]HRX85498.1 hypothetical protein [Phycisphaerae bacterium]